MQQALTAPIFRSVVLGGLVLSLGAVHVGTTSSNSVTRRLVLHAVEEPNAIYLSAWDEGDVKVTFDAAELHPLTFEMRASVYDGCRWLGTETLVPIDDRSYAYDYSETILSCNKGAVPLRKTPRTGIVTVED